MEFIKGDNVWLKSGSPPMMVEEIYEVKKCCKCVWFVETVYNSQNFDFQVLTKERPKSIYELWPH